MRPAEFHHGVSHGAESYRDGSHDAGSYGAGSHDAGSYGAGSYGAGSYGAGSYGAGPDHAEPDRSESYPQLMERLARLQATLAAEQEQTWAWYTQQEAAAQAAVGRAAEAVAAASAEVEQAHSALERIDIEAHRLWRMLGDRVGLLGAPPAAAPFADPGDDPFLLLRGVEDRLDRTGRRPGVLPSWVSLLLVAAGVAGAGVGYAAAWGARWAALKAGGEVFFAPALKLIVTLLAPFFGLMAAKLVADRRGARLDAGAVGLVIVPGLLTLGALLVLVGR